MAQALIDIHNMLPDGLDEVLKEMPEDVDSPFEWLEEQFSNLLVDLWKVMHRFPHKTLESELGSPKP